MVKVVKNERGLDHRSKSRPDPRSRDWPSAIPLPRTTSLLVEAGLRRHYQFRGGDGSRSWISPGVILLMGAEIFQALSEYVQRDLAMGRPQKT